MKMISIKKCKKSFKKLYEEKKASFKPKEDWALTQFMASMAMSRNVYFDAYDFVQNLETMTIDDLKIETSEKEFFVKVKEAIFPVFGRNPYTGEKMSLFSRILKSFTGFCFI